MGILFWQLSDTWQGVSCSTIEYSLRPRASFYLVQNAFSEVLLRSEIKEYAHSVTLIVDTNSFLLESKDTFNYTVN